MNLVSKGLLNNIKQGNLSGFFDGLSNTSLLACSRENYLAIRYSLLKIISFELIFKSSMFLIFIYVHRFVILFELTYALLVM